MRVSVRKTRQFPDGVIDLVLTPGKETILIYAGQRHDIWISGKSEGRVPIFGTIFIRVHQGPRGFGIEIQKGIADVPLTIHDDRGFHETNWVSISELVPEPTGPKEWRPR